MIMMLSAQVDLGMLVVSRLDQQTWYCMKAPYGKMAVQSRVANVPASRASSIVIDVS